MNITLYNIYIYLCIWISEHICGYWYFYLHISMYVVCILVNRASEHWPRLVQDLSKRWTAKLKFTCVRKLKVIWLVLTICLLISSFKWRKSEENKKSFYVSKHKLLEFSQTTTRPPGALATKSSPIQTFMQTHIIYVHWCMYVCMFIAYNT